MIIQKKVASFLAFLFVLNFASAQVKKPPIMGWSSWNNFRVNIDEQMIREQADAMISTGLYDAGYRLLNIDDGFFGGRDSVGKIFLNSTKFPSGMGALVKYIHSKKLKAGIYTDAGMNTCGSIYDKDSLGIGVGLYGHLNQDLHLYLKEWDFDFLKVDWCGGKVMKLDDQTEYTKIIRAAKAIRPTVNLNVCRWQFPGVWAVNIADSWRVSEDIEATFHAIVKIIDLNAELYMYSSEGHYNDMDMLQVGRGMTFEEDKTHFSMWSMMNSPLLAGNDLRSMTKETTEILTNKEIIALNQDAKFIQARRVLKLRDVEVWEKELVSGKAIAIMNRGDETASYTLTPQQINVTSKALLRDLWLHKNLGAIGSSQTFTIPKHGIVVLKVL
jgi:alpha-galactosidase